MTKRYVFLAAVGLAAPLLAQPVLAQTALPANLQADLATAQQDQAAMKTAWSTLKADRTAGNTAAVAADHTALRLARMKLAQDLGALHQDAQPLLQPSQEALVASLTQLHTDQVANNAAAVQTDQAAVTAAEQQLESERSAIFGSLHAGFGGRSGRHWSHHG